jgi:hypothetical protein
MARVADVINILLFVAACAAFALGIHALGDRRDLAALYWLTVGGLAHKGATDNLRPKSRPP